MAGPFTEVVLLLHALNAVGFLGQVAAVARAPGHRQQPEATGLARVLNPFDDAADHEASSLRREIRSKEYTACPP